MTKLFITFVMIGLLALSFAQTADPHHPDQANQTVQPPATSQTQTQSPMMGQPMDMMQMMQMPMGMMGGNLMMLSGRAFEQAFLSMMIPHHQSAVEMSRTVLATTTDTEVRVLAEAIISAQEKEIEEMQAWLSELGGTNLAAQSMMSQSMGSMMTTMNDMGMNGTAQTANPDKAFLEAMVEHHLSAIDMGSQALRKASNPQILTLAANIVSSQASEVLQMRQKLATLSE